MSSLTTIHESRAERKTSQAYQVLWIGIAVSFIFTALIAWGGTNLDRTGFLPDTGASWYWWKLPNPTFWTRATAWAGYVLHQVAMWGLIWYAQKHVKRYSARLHRVNWIALGVNAFFILLHFVQTQIWYDGLAQDVSIWSSQGSVILMLVMILLMEAPRRGLFWGKKISFKKATIDFVRKYHGYVFSWAIVYTFWYHPAENTSGHLIGFFYMFLLMLQGSLMFTRVHVDRRWTIVQEVAVLFHGTLVAIMQGNGMWPMFFFGFGGLFVLTQMHGLKLKAWLKWAFLGAYVIAALVVYGMSDIAMIHQVTWIPIIEYAAVFLLAGVIGLGVRLFGKKQIASA